MKKKLCFTLLLILLACAFSGCCLVHVFANATCTEPATCIKCGKTEGEAMEHDWIDATCTEPKTCVTCNTTMATPLGHSIKDGLCSRCGYMSPIAEPSNGQVFIDVIQRKTSEITIHASNDEACYIKLKDRSGQDILSFYVRAGKTAAVEVPDGSYYVYFATGETWYGTEHLFGSETSYSMDDEIVDFSRYTISYTLFKTTMGNFSETPISASEF